MTGRELVGLHVFGYTYRHGHPALGEVAVCADTRQADGAYFATYLRQIAAYSADDAWRVLVPGQTP